MRKEAVFILIVLVLGLATGSGAENPFETRRAAMRMDAAQFRAWAERPAKAHKARMDASIAARLSRAGAKGTSMSLLPYLQYDAGEREQGKCGNCWVWASTALYEIYLGVNKPEIADRRLSVQYVNSCKTYDTVESCACCGGDLATFTSWYNGQGKAIPWSNTNAAYADAARTCSDAYVCSASTVSCDAISKTPSYSLDKFRAETIETIGVTQKTAIENVKNVLNQKKAVEFSFALANGQDWDAFEHFWNNEGETALWDHDKYCGKQYDGKTGCAHAMVLVGYNDDAPNPDGHYWIILNSSGTGGGKRPNGLFHIPMHMNYDCKLKQESGSYYVTHFETLGEKTGKSLSLNLKGSGEGKVVSDPPGIDCNTSNRTCSGDFEEGEAVTLTAVTNRNSTFAGWSGGGCSGTGTCTVILDDDVEVTDEFDSDCAYRLPNPLKTVPAKGGTVTVAVRADNGDDCPSPEVVKNDAWIETKEPAFTKDRGSVTVIAEKNEYPVERSAHLTVGGEDLTVKQAATVCNIASLKPASAQFFAEGGQETFDIQTQAGCDWDVAVGSKATGWVTIDAGTSGRGAGSVTFTVDPNDGKARTGAIIVGIAGEENTKRKLFTVNQKKQEPHMPRPTEAGRPY